MDERTINEELQKIAGGGGFNAPLLGYNVSDKDRFMVNGRVTLDQLRDLVVLMERIGNPSLLPVKGHPKEEFDNLLRYLGARVPLDDGTYDLSFAFTVTTTGYMVTDASLQLVPRPSEQKAISTVIRDEAVSFKKNTGKWPNTVLLGPDRYEELRRACPHGSAIAYPGMDELGTQVTLRIVRTRHPSELRVGLV